MKLVWLELNLNCKSYLGIGKTEKEKDFEKG
jgi:hypothetical protein